MPQDTYNYLFTSDEVPEATFTVISFTGYQAISELYRYEIELKAAAVDAIDLELMLNSDVCFISRDSAGSVDYPVYGVLASFEEIKSELNHRYYKAVLVPRLWKLTTYKTNEIFYTAAPGQKIKVIIEDIFLNKASLNSDDFFIDINESRMLSREYVCQFNETNFNFISRLLENEGLFYYFDQTGTREKIVIINDYDYPLIDPGNLVFDVAAMVTTRDDIVSSLSCRKQRLPANVIIRDYNADEPSLDVIDDSDIDANGVGSEYIYGKNVKTPDEALYLAEIRAQELACQKTQFFGESSVPRLLAGYVFSLGGHPNPDYNALDYLVVEVNHQGANLDMIVGSPGGNQAQYTNSFVAIPTTDSSDADLQYRPRRKTRKPRITGTLHARVDGELNSQYAQMDAEGRYKVSLPFDFQKADRSEGQASAYVRMMQPYAGADQGMQFPLLKDTEVLLSFVDGDPDRPMIAGAINNVTAPGPVNADNAFQSIIQSAAKNRLKLNDLQGAESTVIDSPAGNSSITTGIPGETIILNGAALVYVELNDTWTDPGARVVVKDTTGELNPTYTSTQVTHTSIIAPGGGTTFDAAATGIYRYIFESGTAHAIRTVIVYDPATDIDDVLQHKTGVQIRTAGIMETEALNRVGHYVGGKPVHASTKSDTDEPDHIGDLLNNFGTQYDYDVDGTDVTKLTSIGGYNPTNLWKYGGTTGYTKPPGYEEIDIAMIGANIQVSSVDTFNTQIGNIYDFGGYWNYDLGNSYAEGHIDQSAELNIKHHKPWTDPPAATGEHAFNYIFNIALPLVLGAAGAPNFASLGGAVYAGIIGGGITTFAAYTATHAIAENTSSLMPNNTDGIGDVIAGPGTATIKTWADKVGTSFETEEGDNKGKQTAESLARKRDSTAGNSLALFGPAMDADGNLTTRAANMNTDTTWVEKGFGDSYSFTQGNSIEITHGNSEEHVKGDQYEYKYGGVREATSFTGKGRKVGWEKSGHGQAQEVHWDPVTGQCVSYEYKNAGHFTFSVALPSLPKLSIALSLATLDASVEASVGTSISVKAAAALSMSVSLTAGLSIDFERSVGGKLVNDETTKGFEFNAVGMKAVKEAELKAQKKNLEMAKVLTTLTDKEVEIANGKMYIKKNSLVLDTSDLKFF